MCVCVSEAEAPLGREVSSVLFPLFLYLHLDMARCGLKGAVDSFFSRFHSSFQQDAEQRAIVEHLRGVVTPQVSHHGNRPTTFRTGFSLSCCCDSDFDQKKKKQTRLHQILAALCGCHDDRHSGRVSKNKDLWHRSVTMATLICSSGW